jgi:hypothetical protein
MIDSDGSQCLKFRAPRKLWLSSASSKYLVSFKRGKSRVALHERQQAEESRCLEQRQAIAGAVLSAYLPKVNSKCITSQISCQWLLCNR